MRGNSRPPIASGNATWSFFSPRSGMTGSTPRSSHVEERRDEVGFLPLGRLDLPRERQTRPGPDREVQLVPIEPSGSTGADRGAMPPRCIRVAVPLALRASLHDVALT